MKRFLLLAGLLIAPGVQAQPPVFPQGFWVIEGNPKNQRHVFVRYYNSSRQLIAQDTINKRWINLGKRRNLRKLDQRLKERLLADSLGQMAGSMRRQ